MAVMGFGVCGVRFGGVFQKRANTGCYGFAIRNYLGRGFAIPGYIQYKVIYWDCKSQTMGFRIANPEKLGKGIVNK